MQCYWIPSGTPQTRCPLPDVEEANKPKGKKNKIAITFINLDTSSLRNNMNPSKGTQFPTITWSKHIHIWMPTTKFMPAHFTTPNLKLSDEDLFDLGKLLT